MKSYAKGRLSILAALAVAAFAISAIAEPDSTGTNSSPEAPAMKVKSKGKFNLKPFIGTIASIDKDANTMVVTLNHGGSQTNHIDSKTKIRKEGQPGTLADAIVGEKVRGSAHKDDSGHWVVNYVTIGDNKPKPAVTTPQQ